MFVEKYMTPFPHTILPQATISGAAMEMNRLKFRHLLVAEAKANGKKLVGIVSKYDIARAFPNNSNPFSFDVTEGTVPQSIATIMNRNLITVEPHCPIEDAARILRTRRINALPVLRAGQLAGIITESDIFGAFLNLNGADVPDCRVVIESKDVDETLASLIDLSRQFRLRLHNVVLSHDPEQHNKVVTALRFATCPDQRFVQELVKRGYRLLSLGK